MTFDIFSAKYLLIVLLVFFILFLRVKTLSRSEGPDWVNFYNDNGQVTLIGMVAEPPETKGKWQRIKVAKLAIAEGLEEYTEARKKDTNSALQRNSRRSLRLQGSVFVKTRLYPKYHYGDLLRLTGKPETPPEFEDFSYKEYLKIEGIYSLIDFPEIGKIDSLDPGSKGLLRAGILIFLKRIYTLREQLEGLINKILPEPHASLLAGIVFGIKRNYSEQFYASMQKAGVLHIIVASGYNIVIVSSFFLGFAGMLGRKKNLILVVVGILFYAIIAGLQPPIVRAAIMGGGAILAETFGKRKDALLWLIFSGCVMLFANPLLYKSVSFQLSFSAALGLLLFGSPLQKVLQRVPAIFRESLSTTLAVQVFTLPIVYLNFHEVSYFSLLVNTLVLEAIPFIMGLGALAVFGGFLSVGLGRVLALPVWFLLEYFIKVVGVFI